VPASTRPAELQEPLPLSTCGPLLPGQPGFGGFSGFREIDNSTLATYLLLFRSEAGEFSLLPGG